MISPSLSLSPTLPPSPPHPSLNLMHSNVVVVSFMPIVKCSVLHLYLMPTCVCVLLPLLYMATNMLVIKLMLVIVCSAISLCGEEGQWDVLPLPPHQPCEIRKVCMKNTACLY
jgi:hypothetical protein